MTTEKSNLIESIKGYAKGIADTMTPATEIMPWMISGEFVPNVGHAKELAVAMMSAIDDLCAFGCN